MSSTPTGASGQKLGEMSLSDYIALMKRRKFWFIFPAVAVVVASAVMAWRLPNIYRCEAIILVQPQKVPASFIQSTVTTGMSDRIATIYQQVVAPSRLKRIIDSAGLYPDIRRRDGEQEAIMVMTKAINVEQVTAMGANAPAFRISYKGRNPAQVAQVTNQLTAMFIEENLKVREEQSYGTSDFIDGELKKVEQQLEEKDRELDEIRARYGQELPESGQFHLQEAAALGQQLHATQEKIAQDQQQEADLQALAGTTAPTVDLDLGSSLSGGASQTEELQTKLNSLRSRYGPNHPDVRKLQAELDQAKANEKANEADTPAPKAASPVPRKIHNPVIEAQLEQLDQDLEKQKERQAQLQSDMKQQLSSLQGMPAYKEKIADIQRDDDALQGRYRSLLDKKMAAETATSLESREKSERFVILDSAQIPERPYSPNRPLLMIGGALLGSLVGLGIALGREVLDDSVRNEREAEQILGAPVLTGVPEILTVQQMLQSVWKIGGVAVVTVLVAVGVGLQLAYISERIF
jgi:polysaccharide chain length determinant protein (PEP-CTERM system associated)